MGSKERKKCGLLTWVCVLIGLGFVAHAFLTSLEGENTEWLAFAGSLHPMILHLPIGLMAAIILRSFWGKLAGIQLKSDLAFLWFATAILASLSYLSGYHLAREGGFDQELVTQHLRYAGIFTAFCWVGLGLAFGNAGSLAGFGNLAAACIAITLTGHYGGSMVHGDPLARAPWKADENYLEFLPPLKEEIIVYDHLVQPVLQAKCYSCHDQHSRKGRFRADSIAAMLVGGENGPAILPGKASSSMLIQLIELPPEDDRHMAPKNKPQVNDKEMALLKWWIDEGATPAQTVSKTAAPDLVQPFLAEPYRLLPNPAEEKRLKALREEEKQRTLERRNNLTAKLELLSAEVREAFIFESVTGASLEFNPISIRDQLTDELLLEIKDLLAECSTVDLSYTPVSESAVAAIGFSHHLQSLDLSGTATNIRELNTLSNAVNLTILNLYATPVDREWVDAPQDWPKLAHLYVGNTSLTNKDVAALQRHFPNCEIVGSLTL